MSDHTMPGRTDAGHFPSPKVQILYKNSTSKTLPDGSTVRDLLIQEAIPEKDVKLIFVNGQRASLDTVLKNGDQVGLSPPVGGM